MFDSPYRGAGVFLHPILFGIIEINLNLSMKKVIIDIDGKAYSSLTEGAKALGVSVSALTQCLRGSQMCKGHTVRYFEGAQRCAGGEGRSAEDVVKLIARWYIKEWRGKPIDAEVMISLTNFIKEHWVD